MIFVYSLSRISLAPNRRRQRRTATKTTTRQSCAALLLLLRHKESRFFFGWRSLLLCICESMCGCVSESLQSSRYWQCTTKWGPKQRHKKRRTNEGKTDRDFKKRLLRVFFFSFLVFFKLYGNTVKCLATGGGGARSGSTAFLLLGYSKSGKNV